MDALQATAPQYAAPQHQPIQPSGGGASPSAFAARDHIDLVRAAAGGLYRRSSRAAERDELLSAGYRGLVEAASRFAPNGGAAFSTFAYPRVVGAMHDELRAALSDRQNEAEPLSADDLADPTPSPHDVAAAREILAALASALAGLPERQQRLVEGCFFEGKQLADVAEELGLSVSRASRLRSRALSALRRGAEESL